ncbi:hypothetical protein COHA_005410 [Chlorella ohadii]|uniref:Rhodanese domain-containing protein n=1 Tax=Chlorella ohadii TaxID=2649997 RepID=A0AAD5DPT5_9CHLO|nr:hypothetical protein COHA_005410 [Chlorella ohadii]
MNPWLQYAMSKKIAGHFPDVPVINCTDLKRTTDDPLRAQTVVVVDVRGPAETEVSMIPGSLTKEEYEARKEEFAGKTVVTYCTVGYRSCGYAQKLRQQGLDAKNLEGSIVRWCQKRYPIVVRSKAADGSVTETETKRVHTYGKAWALQPDDYEAVMFKRPFLAGVRNLLPSWLAAASLWQVVFTRKRPGQKDKTVAQNPSTLEKVEPGSSDEESEELGKAKSAVQRSGRGRKAKGGKKKGAAGKKGGSGAGKESESSEEEENGGQDAGGPKKAPTKKVAGGGGGKSAGGSAHAARHSSRIATRRHRREAGTSEAVAGEEKVGYRKRSKREE